MISALRKIEGRGELPGATSAVMEMCLDNPRQGFGELFDTHPSVDSRVAALVKFAGGHDPGPIALPPPARKRRGRRSIRTAVAQRPRGARRYRSSRGVQRIPGIAVTGLPAGADRGGRTLPTRRNRVTINHIPLKIGITQRVRSHVAHLEASKQSRLCVRLH